MTTETTVWQADFVVPNAEAPTIEVALDALPRLAEEGIYAQFEDGKTHTRFALYINGQPSADLVTALEAAAGTKLDFRPVPEEDWVTKSNQALSPFFAGRFYITPREPEQRTPLTLFVPAGLAFGTGAHETTLGCLHLIDRLMHRYMPERAIDLGCGTGILAMALVKAGARNVIASDNDRDAVIVTEDNMKANDIPAHCIKPVLAEGFDHQALDGQFDLIVANILARPLIDLAPDIKRHLAPGGSVILSGLLTTQEQDVLAAYTPLGLHLHDHFRAGDWSALLLS